MIDLGGNIATHGKWSDEVDWKSIFYGSNEKPRIKKEVLDQTKDCNSCGAIISRTAIECVFCGAIDKPKKSAGVSDEVATLIDEIPMPDGRKIVAYVQKIDRDKSFAWVILQNQIIDIFVRHSVTFGMYSKAEKNGKFEISMRNIIKEPYSTIQGSELEGTKLRTKAYIINKIKIKIEKYYESNSI